MTDKSQTDPVVEGRAFVSELKEFHVPDHEAGFRASELITRLCDEVERLQSQVRLCEQAFQLDEATQLSEVGNLNTLQVVRLVAKANNLRSSIVSLIEAKAAKWQGIAEAGLPNDRTAERAATSARTLRDLAKEIGEIR